jgi:hypothetical protein
MHPKQHTLVYIVATVFENNINQIFGGLNHADVAFVSTERGRLFQV